MDANDFELSLAGLINRKISEMKMPTPRNLIIEYIEQGIIPGAKIGDALKSAGIIPDGKSWKTFIDRVLLYIGGLALAFAVMFFIAYNWDDLGKFSKFGMVEALIVLSIVFYCRFGKETAASKVSLLAASICVGVLLALYGQTYQTGADPWQLFFTWSLFILPWAVIGRFPALWILWLALINTSVVLYHQTFTGVFEILLGYRSPMLWQLFIFNTAALLALAGRALGSPAGCHWFRSWNNMARTGFYF